MQSVTTEININQERLVNVLRLLFPNDDVVVESRKKTQLRYDTGGYVELDIWVPQFNLSFEFQDEYHYTDTWYSHKQLADVRQSDKFKRDSARAVGMTLIDIPCWWDGSVERLVATIHFYRPDINIKVPTTDIVSLNPPFNYFAVSTIPDVGTLMLASFPIMSNDLPDSVHGWWLGEKYDGIRCCWNPSRKKMFTRTGNECELLLSIYFHLPPVRLDAELWSGRNNFYSIQNLVSGADTNFFKWHYLRLNAFDIPSVNAHIIPFEERYFLLLSDIPINSPIIINAPRLKCNDILFVSRMINKVIKEEGEGVIVRMSSSFYEPGRSHSLLKFKGYHGDQEAVVMGVASDKTVTLKLLNGQLFTVPPQNVRVPHVATGDVVSFSFENFAKKSEFVNPTIFRIREDVNWSEAVYNMQGERSAQKEEKEGRERKYAKRFWTEEAMREVFEKTAKEKNRDPLLAETWFHISYADVELVEGGKTILQYFKGYVTALQHLFPEFEHSITELSQYHGQNKWSELTNRRKLFEKIANDMNFNPLIPDNWYYVKREQILDFKGASTVMRYYNNNVARALVSIFPDIGLDKSKLYNELHSDDKKRKFFEDYAKENQFDPKIPENWYSQSTSRILEYKGSKSVMHSYNGSVSTALSSLFPDIGLDKSLFDKWKVITEQRRFFEQLADRNSFHPYHADNWYSVSRDSILATKGAHAILRHYEGSIAKALVNIFPDIGIDKSKFSKKIFKQQKIFT